MMNYTHVCVTLVTPMVSCKPNSFNYEATPFRDSILYRKIPKIKKNSTRH